MTNKRGSETGKVQAKDWVPIDDLPDTPAQPPLAAGFDPEHPPFPVVGIGGSAGSIEALLTFFSNLPADSAMAYVVVVHLSPEHESMLPSVLQNKSPIPVIEVTSPMKLRPNEVYVITPGKQLSLCDGFVHPAEMSRERGRHVTVDLFFRTLAEAHGSHGIAIVLSGANGDGAIGLKRVKERGGLTIAQDPTEAENESMPRTSISTGMVDWILPAAEMPRKLMEFRENGRKVQLPSEIPPPFAQNVSSKKSDETALNEVLRFLMARTGHDFGSYKRATILRRIGRRMQVNGTIDLKSYLAYLRLHPGETGALLQDLLISVTNFFRDREAFRAIEDIVPELFKGKGPADQVRVWVPACATGEEAYSIAILLCEHAAKLEAPPQIQIFATDLDRTAISSARDGHYPEAIAADVSEDRLRSFFARESSGYRVRRSIREVVLFAVHDLLKDSPFSRLDLVCCRNLLIYLTRDTQMRVFDIFHFALRPGAMLFLGSSESAEEASSLFLPVDKKQRLYAKRAFQRVGLSLPAGAPTLSFAIHAAHADIPILGQQEPVLIPRPGEISMAKFEGTNRNSWSELHLKLIEQLAPPSLVVSHDHEIVHLSKSAGRYLQISGGAPTMNILRVIHAQLRAELRAALFRAGKSDEPVEIKGIPVELDGVPRRVDLKVMGTGDQAAEFLLVIFQEHESAEADNESLSSRQGDTLSSGVLQHLEEEVDQLRSRLRETVEQYEASTEELKASNEELQAMNEELRSATEELETGREELQSINEETITINQELKSKVEELSRANSDLQNLMASTNIATIFLDRQLQIKRFTPSTSGLFNFILTDIGRPLSHITHRLDYPDITADAEKVLENLNLVEREVRDADGRWFLARMLPYRTPEDQIAGVVITCVDITARKESEKSRGWLSAIVESSNDAIISFTMDGDIVSWNHGAERIFGYTSEEIKGRSLSVLAPQDKQEEKTLDLEMLKRGETIDNFESIRVCKNGSLIAISFSASVMKNEAGEIVGATAIIQNITERKRAIEVLKQVKDDLEIRVEERTAELMKRAEQLSLMASELTLAEQRERKRLAHILHDQFQQILVAARMRAEALQPMETSKKKQDCGELIGLIDEALENSRSLVLELSPPVLAEGLGKAIDWLCGTWIREKYDLEVNRVIDTSIDIPHDDMRILVFIAVRELLFNVVKHSKVRKCRVELSPQSPEFLRVAVRDHGVGFEEEMGNKSGFGLISLRERLELMGGKLEIHSTRSEGVEAVILVPRAKAPHGRSGRNARIQHKQSHEKDIPGG